MPIKVDPVSKLQPFRVYQISKTSSEVVTVRARHLAYDLKGIPVSPFAAEGLSLAFSGLSENAVVECPFSFTTDKGASATAYFVVAVPASIWSLLGGSDGGILDTYGGEYEFDEYSVKLWNRRGADRGVSIRYGKNLTSLEQDENCANCYTGVFPYWRNADGQFTRLTGNIVYAPGSYNYKKILVLDLSAEWKEMPSQTELRTRTEKYISDNDIGTPAVSWKVEFVQLEQTEEYKGKALLERVLLGDTVSVEFEEMCISAAARAVAVDYDSILERYNSITLGRVKANVASAIAEQNKQMSSKPSKSEMQLAIEQLTSSILGATGGAVRLLDTNGDGAPDTLYIADNADPAQAVKVWRFNYEGWGASSTGYDGPFVMGATLDDGMIAEFMKAGVLSSADGLIRIDLSGGDEPIFNTGISTNGLTVRSDQSSNTGMFRVTTVKMQASDGTVKYLPRLVMYRATGPSIFEVMVGSDGVASSRLVSDDLLRQIILTAGGSSSGVSLTGSTGDYGSFVVNENDKSVLSCNMINPGKKLLYSGSVAVGNTCDVPDTNDYDLFAVRLGDSTGAFWTTILAYKYGSVIRGVGGWSGSETEQKELYFVSVTISGNTWTLLDCGYHKVPMAGGISEGTRLQLKEVKGII